MKLNKEILRLAVPSILANITVPLVGMVDIAIAGHLGAVGYSSAALIGGISIGTMLFDLLYWNFGFLRVGTGGLTAQAYGERLASCKKTSENLHELAYRATLCKKSTQNMHELAQGAICNILRRALRIAWLSGLALLAVQWLVVQAVFLVVDCTPEVRALAQQYFYIRIWAAPATLSLFAFKGWFIGLQDTVRPMVADFLVNGLNILASVVLSLGVGGDGVILPGSPTLVPALGFPGIALGTVLAQWSGFVYSLLTACRRYGFTVMRKTSYSAAYNSLSVTGNTGRNTELTDTEENSVNGAGQQYRFFQLNRDLFLRSLGMIAVYIGFTVISARYGDLMLAVSAILMKFLMIFSYFTDGFAYAGEALTGRFIGERSEDGVKSAVRGTFAWSLGVAALFMLLYGLGGVPLFRLMTADTTVVEAGRAFVPWLLLMPLIGCPAFVWDGIFIGATASTQLRNSTLLCAVGFFAVWFAGLALAGERITPEGAIHILMAAYFVHLAVRALYLTLTYRRIILSLMRKSSSSYSHSN